MGGKVACVCVCLCIEACVMMCLCLIARAARCVFQLGHSQLSSYQLVVEGAGRDPGRGVVTLDEVVSRAHPVLVELHTGKVTLRFRVQPVP